MEGIIFQPVNYSGHAFTEGLHARRDPGTGPGFYVFGRNAEKYGRKPDGSGAYVAMVARPAVKPRRHPHYNCAVRRGWRTKREAEAVARRLARRRFAATFEIVTAESAEHGDAETRGWISRAVELREAVADLFATRTSRVDGIAAIEPSDSEPSACRWITVYNGMEFETGATESRALHLPETMTAASRARLFRLLKGV